ncbi:hypothetical protein DFJ74DRAFT_364395 [Hyaloraphidium curvatum]|nr:hypothetical protein DFJ74DRAFT_364395 [Hyaloraphidium curvatum]
MSPHPAAAPLASQDASTGVRITASTRLIVSTSGRPSSVRRYNKLLQELLGADIAYLPISSDEPGGKISPQRFVWALRGLDSVGGAISRDIKAAVVPFLDSLDPLARAVGSVNTVVRERGTLNLKGYNTDALGFQIAVRDGLAKAGIEARSAVVYGYGGVTPAVVHVLKTMGLKVFITGRRPDAAREAASKLGAEPFPDGAQADLFVNAAPIGDAALDTVPHFLPALSGARAAFDHEMPGAVLRERCDANGILHIPGTDMYYPQMVAQWTLFLDGLCKEEDVERLLKEADK